MNNLDKHYDNLQNLIEDMRIMEVDIQRLNLTTVVLLDALGGEYTLKNADSHKLAGKTVKVTISGDPTDGGEVHYEIATLEDLNESSQSGS